MNKDNLVTVEDVIDFVNKWRNKSEDDLTHYITVNIFNMKDKILRAIAEYNEMEEKKK